MLEGVIEYHSSYACVSLTGGRTQYEHVLLALFGIGCSMSSMYRVWNDTAARWIYLRTMSHKYISIVLHVNLAYLFKKNVIRLKNIEECKWHGEHQNKFFILPLMINTCIMCIQENRIVSPTRWLGSCNVVSLTISDMLFSPYESLL